MRLVFILLISLLSSMFSKSHLLQSSLRRTSRFSSSLYRSSSTASMIKSTPFKNGSKRIGSTMLALALGMITASSYHSSIALKMTSASEGGKDVDKFSNTALYPLGKLLEKGLLKVNDKHQISYSVYGNPNGKPAVKLSDPLFIIYFLS